MEAKTEKKAEEMVKINGWSKKRRHLGQRDRDKGREKQGGEGKAINTRHENKDQVEGTEGV